MDAGVGHRRVQRPVVWPVEALPQVEGVGEIASHDDTVDAHRHVVDRAQPGEVDEAGAGVERPV
jgi:hypothetical protein